LQHRAELLSAGPALVKALRQVIHPVQGAGPKRKAGI
jgi:hypothetical protein